MSDLLKRITAMISSPLTSPEENAITISSPLVKYHNKTTSPFFSHNQHQRRDLTFSDRNTAPVKAPPSMPIQEKKAMTTADENDNIKALKKLRELPRGTQVESRIAAIENLLGEPEIFKTLKMLRWPQGVICPRCHSSNTVRREPPPDSTDQRHFYICLNCKGEGSPSDFDDFTGLPIKSIRALRQWMLCWYLIGFCSLNQIAKVLGISAQEVAKIAQLGTELTELPEEKEKLTATIEQEKKTQSQHKEFKARVEQQEEYTRSESKSPFKPGPKSKK